MNYRPLNNRIRSLAPNAAIVVAGLLLLSAVPVHVLAQEDGQGTSSSLAKPQNQGRPAQIDDLTVEQILNVRERLGGGVGSILSGVELGTDAELKELLRKEFEAELMRLSRESAAESGLRSGVNVGNALRGPVSVPGNPLSQVNNQVTQPINSSPVQPSNFGNALNEADREARQREKHVFRQVARHLEELAWEMEEIDAYGEADRLRELSASMRMRVRNRPQNQASPIDPGRTPSRRR